MSKAFKLGTFNVRGLTEEHKQELLHEDLKKYRLDVCCLQETKIKTVLDVNLTISLLINFNPDRKFCGCGLIMT